MCGTEAPEPPSWLCSRGAQCPVSSSRWERGRFGGGTSASSGRALGSALRRAGRDRWSVRGSSDLVPSPRGLRDPGLCPLSASWAARSAWWAHPRWLFQQRPPSAQRWRWVSLLESGCCLRCGGMCSRASALQTRLCRVGVGVLSGRPVVFLPWVVVSAAELKEEANCVSII